ncbi:MAG: hypothetical protein GWN67_07320 [Phycisphaerae bacterium]|nr:hypothetical protein [Phycisphaerae bacterium]NIP51821.1 hypothetical protein [Phycisphaerae bacterium]NIS50953.1 hypothetical protein [Phycisphaerae bacterium]NIU07887.1 hypothetical protein [Phycisphaerae bacterium]NIU56187.1 hypothetical protein [Phycisphaerae bacterium]
MRAYRPKIVITALILVTYLAFASAAAAEESRIVNLLELSNPIHQVAAGRWEFISGSLVVDDTRAARMNFPYKPPAEYDYIVKFVTTKPGGNIAFLLSKGKVPFAWSLNTRGHMARLEDIDGHSIINNPCLRRYVLEPWKQYTAEIQVRKSGVRCLINGQVVQEKYKTDYSDLSRNVKWTMPRKRLLGIGSYSGFMNIVLEAKVREITGHGRIVVKKAGRRGRRNHHREEN